MLKCAMGQLQEDERSRRLASREPQALLLATQIRDKAEGVFLWVSLVTRSLKRGLSERDDTNALERRLAQTPSDLKKYFRSIFKNIDDNYKDLTMRASNRRCRIANATGRLSIHSTGNRRSNLRH
jgi:hypothetical protein